jgi:hypothetical protein
MDKNGKMVDVLIEESIGSDPRTGMPIFFGFSVWADAGMKDIIKNIPGVYIVLEFNGGTHYDVSLDPRYNREFLKAEIEAQIKINSDNIE